MIEALGWVSTLLVLTGYILNARQLTKYAMATWILGDIGWVVYDFFIYNISHMMLSFIIITINIYGRYNVCKEKNK